MDNAEGSSKAVTELTAEQVSVLVGTLLGDGCLALHGRNARLHIKHKTAHRSLVEYKYSVFRDFIGMSLHEFDQRLNDKGYPCVQFATRTNPLFTEWHRLFYTNGKKHVPMDIGRDLTPLALAVWFMDDGAADHAGATFQTHGFSSTETNVLKEALQERFGLATTIRSNRGGSIIYVPASSLPTLSNVVEPHLLSDFRYKLIPTRFRTP